jgi:hypothetical protein
MYDTRGELKAWIFANVIRGPICGDVYTCWHDDHVGLWFVHGIGGLRDGDTKILMLTDGYNCTIKKEEWDTEVRNGRLRFTGDNHLWK